MATSPSFILSTQAFPQRWDGTNLQLQILVMPQGDPLSPLITGVAPAPDSPAFADAQPTFVAELIPSLAALPAPGAVTASIPLVTSAPANARTLFTQLGGMFSIVPNPPGQTPRRVGFETLKYLPQSYRNAFNFNRPSTPFALTDNTYHCLLENPTTTTIPPPPPSTVTWGRVIGFALRQPLLATAVGLIYQTTLTLPEPTYFQNGGWLFVNFAADSDFSAQLAVKPSLMQAYAARIPALSAPRPLFAAVLFPVTATPSGSYDAVFTEAEQYDDGFVKIVHGSQPIANDILDTSGNGLPATADFGLNLGWDDEQITIWFNRQLDATQVDAPLGVAGYRLDVREHGTTAWNSLCAVTGAIALGSTSLGTFDGEFGVETVPANLDPTQPSQWWLPSYFSHWRGGSAVLPDPIAQQLHGDPHPTVGPYTAAPQTFATPLVYGNSYDVRVRLMDLTRGGPQVTDTAIDPGPAPIADVPFRRFVPFKAVTITNLDLTATPSAPQTTYDISRPLLNYPAVVFTGLPNAVNLLLADLPNAMAQGREAALPDPDAAFCQIDVQIRQLAGDAALYAGTDPAPYSLLYSTQRAFPTDTSQQLTLDVTFEDVPDISAFPSQPATGPLVLPRARDVRLIFYAVPNPDPQLQYWGSTDAMSGGATIEVLTGTYGSDERAIFTPDIEANRICGIMLQPELDDPSGAPSRLALALDLNLSGLTFSAQPGQRVLFGCSPALRSTISPEHSAITFASNTEITQQWIVAITLQLARDWSWGSLAPTSFQVTNTSGTTIGSIETTASVSMSALTPPVDRSVTRLIFFDAVDPKPASGSFPAELNLTYTVTPVFATPPAQVDPPLSLPVLLPIAANPVQTPVIASAGVALSPFQPASDYSSTSSRQRMLWFEFTQAIADPDDCYFARVLAYAPDQLLTGMPWSNPGGIDPPAEPPLPIDPELIRTIVPGQSADSSGLDAMQQMIPSNSPLHYMLPLPSGMSVDATELFGLFVYEFRVGHAQDWSTAQARFGPPLRVAGVQHPAPVLLAQVDSQPGLVGVSAPYATPTFNGRNLLPAVPQTQLWALLYAQVTQADNAHQRNVLLDRRLLRSEERAGAFLAPAGNVAETIWSRPAIETILLSLSLPLKSPLSTVVVETYRPLDDLADPLGGDLGHVRILRTSPLTPIPQVC
ncbi:MAG TPA: hypothetical protein VMG98_02200 [Verrucomicrobiae bacterium]|nr:hypothetical protein [Verrucomicrobiae bacterium]